MPPKKRFLSCEICGERICRRDREKRKFMAKFPLDESRSKQTDHHLRETSKYLNTGNMCDMFQLHLLCNIVETQYMLAKTRLALACVKTISQIRQNEVQAKRRSKEMETLCGVVAVVEVEAEERTIQLCTTLKDLGATVLPLWSPLVTHVIWAKGGCRATRSVARAQASFVVSPMWVDACASAKRRLPEQAFPTTPRESDLPSPKRLLKIVDKALREKVPVIDFLPCENEIKRSVSNLRLPCASETDTLASRSRSTEPTNTRNAVASTLVDTSMDIAIESRVNTARRRALPISMSPPPVPTKSRRMLFTQKEVRPGDNDAESEEDINMPGPSTSKRPRPVKIPKPGEPSTSGVGPSSKRARTNLTQRERKDLDRAERMANKLVEEKKRPVTTGRRMIRTRDGRLRIVLSGMTREERRKVHQICQNLNAKIQSRVNKHTTHVILGDCLVRSRDTSMAEITYTPAATGTNGSNVKKLRTANALMGAARGCRIVSPQWAFDSETAGKWLNYALYEVPHLKKLADKAYEERRAFSLMKDEFGYDVFIGKKIRLSSTAQNRSSCERLLALCGAVVLSQDNRILHNQNLYEFGRYSGNENFSEEPDGPVTPDYSIGTGLGQVRSSWVFDSVAAARMKTVHRYVHIP